jgi:pimeloyl-ACP methyl ester carboxylesterase
MDSIKKNTIIFFVGLGAPANLYTHYLNDLRKRLPQTQLQVFKWWNQQDFDINILKSYIENTNVTFIGHSGGSVVSLKALMKWPHLIEKIIMLDSHFLKSRDSLPSVSDTLEIMLKHDNSIIQEHVKNAYKPVIENPANFNNAFQSAITWVNTWFNEACELLSTLPAHSALHIGFTNSRYEKLNIEDKKTLEVFWNKYHVDVKTFLINHFDLIDVKEAAAINQCIVEWLGT